MKDHLSKIIAVSLPLILAFSIQECSTRNAPETESTEAITEIRTSEIIVYDPNDPNNPANHTTEEEDTNNDVSGEVTGTDNETDPSASGLTLPTDKSGIINLYNSALDKTSGIKRTSYTRKLTLCKITMLGDKTNDPKVQELSAMDDKNPAASNLVKLNDSMVSNASAKEEGGNFIFEITLGNHSSGQNIKNGDGGFVGMVEFNETKSLVKSIAKEALGLDVDMKDNPKYELSAGKYTITIDSQSGKLKNVKHSFTEGGEGKVSIATVTLSIDLTAEYAV